MNKKTAYLDNYGSSRRPLTREERALLNRNIGYGATNGEANRLLASFQLACGLELRLVPDEYSNRIRRSYNRLGAAGIREAIDNLDQGWSMSGAEERSWIAAANMDQDM